MPGSAAPAALEREFHSTFRPMACDELMENVWNTVLSLRVRSPNPWPAAAPTPLLTDERGRGAVGLASRLREFAVESELGGVAGEPATVVSEPSDGEDDFDWTALAKKGR